MGNTDLKSDSRFDPSAMAAIRFAVKEALDEKLGAADQSIVESVVIKLSPECTDEGSKHRVHPMFDPLAGP